MMPFSRPDACVRVAIVVAEINERWHASPSLFPTPSDLHHVRFGEVLLATNQGGTLGYWGTSVYIGGLLYMKTTTSFVVMAALAPFAVVAPARADPWTITVTGTVYSDGPYGTPNQTGLFGTPGQSLVGLAYTQTITTDPLLNTYSHNPIQIFTGPMEAQRAGVARLPTQLPRQ